MAWLGYGFGILAILGAGVLLWRTYRAGKREQEARSLEKALDHAAKAGEIDETVARLSDARIDGLLRGDDTK